MSQFDLDTGDAVRKVKFMVSVLRIRLHEFFCDFDGLRCGYITPTQFKSGLSMSGIARFVDQKQLDQLTEQFIDPNDKQKRVKYVAFCEEIETVFTRKNLEKSLHTNDESDATVTVGIYTNRCGRAHAIAAPPIGSRAPLGGGGGRRCLPLAR